jgi:hypothetical protein
MPIKDRFISSLFQTCQSRQHLFKKINRFIIRMNLCASVCIGGSIAYRFGCQIDRHPEGSATTELKLTDQTIPGQSTSVMNRRLRRFRAEGAASFANL